MLISGTAFLRLRSNRQGGFLPRRLKTAPVL
ncbi:erythromycin resistance leader peptide [Trueperella pyogenes]